MVPIPFSRRFRQRFPRFSRTLALTVCFLVAFGAGFAYASWALVCRAGRCPSANALEGYEPRQTSKLYAADGRFIAEIGLERRTILKIGDIPPLVRNAFVVTEDKRFYQHSGIDWRSIPRALLVDIKNRNWSEGFSTITMQLARNIFPERISRDKTLIRKLKEAKVARAIEDRYPKDKILELYLNQIYLGNGAYGVETAAERYFGKTVKQLNVAEAATLAALPKGPERYNPRRFPDRAVQRRNTIIGMMRDASVISPTEASLAQAYPLRLATRVESGEVAPYFVEWVRQLLDDRFGAQLYEQGLKVYTSLDIDLQTAAERALDKQLRAIEAGHYGPYNHTTYDRYMARSSGDEDNEGASSPYLQGAFVAMDPRTGAVRALVGGRDFDDSKFDRAVQAVRQPGSAFKPIVYTDAIQNGRPLSYLLDNSPLTIQMSNSSTWTPQNYEGTYGGKLPMRQALYESLNVPTVRLGMELGEQSVIDEARRFGITTPIPAYPSIFIGAADVYPIEMVAAYTAFATLGTRAEPMPILKVEDSHGNVLWAPQPTTVPVMSPEEAWLMVSVLKDVVRRGTAASAVGSVFHYPAGGKTGTTNDGTDAWFIGFTSDLVAGVWVGFDKPQKIKPGAQGATMAAPAWTTFMTEAYHRKPAPRDWPMPSDIVTRQIDVTTNMLATQWCPRDVVADEFYIPGTDPYQTCDVHTGPTGLYPDTLGYGSYPYPGTNPPPTYPASPYPLGGPPRPGATVPGSGVSPIRPAQRPPVDTARRSPDTSIFILPGRDTTRRPTPYPRDTTRRRPLFPGDTARPPDTSRVFPPLPPDTSAHRRRNFD